MRAGLVAGLVGVSMMLSGCFVHPEHEHYLRRADTVTLGVGDAVAFNKAVHTVDPWPRHAANDDIEMDGQRALIAVRRYQTDQVKEPATLKVEPFAGAPGVRGGAGAAAGGGG